jgi:hypothetical protein
MTPLNRAHGKYITALADGKLDCSSDVKGPNQAFEIEAQSDGRWALKGPHGMYAGGKGEDLSAFTKVISNDRLWVVHLAMHPQFVFVCF